MVQSPFSQIWISTIPDGHVQQPNLLPISSSSGVFSTILPSQLVADLIEIHIFRVEENPPGWPVDYCVDQRLTSVVFVHGQDVGRLCLPQYQIRSRFHSQTSHCDPAMCSILPWSPSAGLFSGQKSRPLLTYKHPYVKAFNDLQAPRMSNPRLFQPDAASVSAKQVVQQMLSLFWSTIRVYCPSHAYNSFVVIKQTVHFAHRQARNGECGDTGRQYNRTIKHQYLDSS